MGGKLQYNISSAAACFFFQFVECCPRRYIDDSTHNTRFAKVLQDLGYVIIDISIALPR